MFNRLPALARFLFALVAINLLVFEALRGAFWVAFRETLAGRPFVGNQPVSWLSYWWFGGRNPRH